MRPNKRRARLLLLSLVVTFVVMRGYLWFAPNTDLFIGACDVHHLFIGLLLILIGGAPLAVFQGDHRLLDGSTVIFGVGLSLALDEWVYLIVTDGTNASYLLPISFWGGLVMVGLACVLVVALQYFLRSREG